MGKKYLLQIEPYVHITITSTNLILYNTLNGCFFESFDKSILNIIKSEYRLLDNTQLKKKNLIEFISKIQKYFIGELIDIESSLMFPAQIKPNINIEKSIKYLNDNELDYNSFDNYLSEITIFLNSSSENLGKFSEAYKQFFFPVSNEDNYCEINFNKLINFIDQAYSFGTTKINIVAGDLVKYERLSDLMLHISSLKIQCSVYHYFNQINDFEFYNNLTKYIKDFNIAINLLLTLPLNFTDLKEFIEVFPINKLTLIFIVCDILEFEFLEKKITDSLNKYSYKFQPFYTGSNIDFFKDSVFLEKDDIFSKKFEQKDLLPKTILNPNNFGKLTLLNNGLIYSNYSDREIGNLDKFDLNNIIKKVLSSSNFGWMQPRCSVKPCSDCQYNAFCPPISSYEYAIGSYNLCNVW